MPRIPWDTCRIFAQKKSYGGNISYERIETISCTSGELAGTVLEVTKDKGLGVQAIFNDQDRQEFFVVILVALPDNLKWKTYGQEVWQRGLYVKPEIHSPTKSQAVREVPKPTTKEPKGKLDYLKEFPGCIIGFPVALVVMGVFWMLKPFIILFYLITIGVSSLRGRDDGPPDDFGNPGRMGE